MCVTNTHFMCVVTRSGENLGRAVVHSDAADFPRKNERMVGATGFALAGAVRSTEPRDERRRSEQKD
jgi:hypothetical protein